MQVHPENMQRSLTADMLATDLAEYLVRKGVSARSGQSARGAEYTINRFPSERRTTYPALPSAWLSRTRSPSPI